MGGTSSKQTFAGLVTALQTRAIDPADHEFWDELWKTTLPAEDLFATILPGDLRQMIQNQPENVRTLFTQAVAQLYQVVETPYRIYFQQALNCARLLTRLLPVLLEADRKWTRELLWSKRLVKVSGNSEEQGHSMHGVMLEDADDSPRANSSLSNDIASSTTKEAESSAASEDSKQGTERVGSTESATEDSAANQPLKTDEVEKEDDADYQESEPLAVILINTLYHLLFLPDFTVGDPSIEFTEQDVDTPAFKAALLWQLGVGSTRPSGANSPHGGSSGSGKIANAIAQSTPFDSNRVDILRLMLSAFSDALYQPIDGFDSCASMWLEVATSADAPYAEVVFQSLLNTVLGYDPIGWGMPYGNLMATDTAKSVMEVAVQVLIVILDYGLPIKYDVGTVTPHSLPYVLPSDTQAQGFNIFRRYLGAIESPEELQFMFNGFVRLFQAVYQADSTYLPHSLTRIGIEQELLVLFWKCLEECPRFMPYILKSCDVSELLVPICYFMIEGRKDVSKVGLIYLCTFTLLKLSGERNFGVGLNRPYMMSKFPIDVPTFSGNHVDLLIIVLHKLIVSGTEKLSSLYSCCLTIICNVSPYCKSLCSLASVKLVNLLQLFVSPRFLYAAKGNHIYVGLLLETFNNLVQYQYEGNGNLVYALVRRHELFETLASLTLVKAIAIAKEISMGGNVTGNSAGGKQNSKSTTNLGTRGATEESSIAMEATPTDLISTRTMQRRNGTADTEDTQATSEMDRMNSSSSHDASIASGVMTGGGTQEEEDATQNNSGSATKTSADTPRAGKGRFVPTESWLQAVKSELPLNTITRLLKDLLPRIDELTKSGGSLDERQVLEFLRTTTMVGILPVPHPIVIRKYQPNRYTCVWFTAFLWGVIFVHNQRLPLFDGDCVRLFSVQNQ